MKINKISPEILKYENQGLGYVSFTRLAKESILVHAVTTREGGVSNYPYKSLNLSFEVGDDAFRVAKNQNLVLNLFKIQPKYLIRVKQVHEAKVLKVNRAFLDEQIRSYPALVEADVLVTAIPSIALMVLVADCLPVFAFDPVHRAIGLAHAGWRGTVQYASVKMIAAMSESFGTKEEDVRIGLGPCIGPCCYEVGTEVYQKFQEKFTWTSEVLKASGPLKWKLNLSEANAKQLMEFGVLERNIFRSNLCTIQNRDWFFSNRAEASETHQTGRMAAIMMLMDQV